MEIAAILEILTSCHGVSGREYGAAEQAKALLAPYGEVTEDALGNVILSRKGNSPEKKERITLTAHLDEIGMMVREIDDRGFLKIAPVGGLDRRGLMGDEVLVLAEEPLYGVVCSVPPHLTSASDRKKLMELDDLAIDIGFSAEEAKRRVRVGDWAVVLAPLKALQNGLVTGKALDNRAGAASLLWALDKMKGADLSCNVSVIFATMEEVGSMGARTAHYGKEATHAIAVDVTFAASHEEKKGRPCKLRSGAAVGISPLLDRQMSRALEDCAKAHGIPHTLEVMGGRTGTDADAIHVSGAGVKTGLLSIPQRNMHTPAEIVAPEDVRAVGDLIACYIKDQWGKKGGESK